MSSDIVVHNEGWARRITEHLRIQASNFAQARDRIIDLLHEAREGGAAQLLGYESWTAYVSDVFGEQPLRLEKDLRREFVKELSGEGMSTRAIAPIVGASQKTVSRDISTESNDSVEPVPVSSDDFEVAAPDYEEPTTLSPILSVEHHDITEPVDPVTGEIEDEPEEQTRSITGLNGKRYTVPERQPTKPHRNPLPEQFTHRVVELNRVVSSLSRLAEDDRFNNNKQNIALTNGSDIKRAVDALSKVVEQLNK
jgi:hypothetical protein